MLRKADLAMYAAKRGGKRRWDLYDRDLERLGLTTDAEEPERADVVPARRRAARGDRQPAASRRRHRDGFPADSRPAHRPRGGLRGARAVRRAREPAAQRVVRAGSPLGLGYELEARPRRARSPPPAARPAPISRSTSARRRSRRRRSRPSCRRRSKAIVVELTENELVSDAPGLDAALADVRSAAAASRSTTRAPATPGSSTSCGSARPDQARPFAGGGRRARRVAGLPDRLVRRLRARQRRRGMRGGHRDDRRPRPAGRPRRHLRPGIRHRPPRRAVGRGCAPRCVDACTVSFTAALSLPRGNDLEHVVALLAGARDGNDLVGRRGTDRARASRRSRGAGRRVRSAAHRGRPGAQRRRGRSPADLERLAATATARSYECPSPARAPSSGRSRPTGRASAHGADWRSAARA